ncbi:MAG TPA: hypothetical protein PK036_10345, partial [Geobacteraceae bacterium]|nr:hypothetical protein [Geobacteraceae bacterium]
AHPEEGARAILRSLRGKRLDPEITEIFLGLLAHGKSDDSVGENDTEASGRARDEYREGGSREVSETQFRGEEA